MKDNCIKKEKREFLIFLLLIKALYVAVITLCLPEDWKMFSYDKNINLMNLIIEIPILFIEIAFYISSFRRYNPLVFLASFLFCIYIIPVNSTLSLSNYDPKYYFFSNLFCIVLLFCLGRASNRLPKNVNEETSSSLWHSKSFLWIMRVLTIIVSVGTLIYAYAIQGEINFSAIFEDEMYEKRAEFAEFYLNHTNGFLAYFIIVWRGITNTILLICLYASLKQKKWFDILLILFTYMVLFSLSMEKSTFLQPFIAIFIYFVERKDLLSRVNELFIKGYTLLLTIIFIEGNILSEESSVLFKPFVSRLSYMPSYLNHTYYSFFENKSKIWFTSDFFPFDRFVKLFMPAPCPQGMVNTISERCFDSLIPSPNTGLFAESYAQMGICGVLFFPLAIAFISRIYAQLAYNYGLGGSMILLAAFSTSLTNTAVFSTMGMVRLIIFAIVTWIMVKPITSKIRK